MTASCLPPLEYANMTFRRFDKWSASNDYDLHIIEDGTYRQYNIFAIKPSEDRHTNELLRIAMWNESIFGHSVYIWMRLNGGQVQSYIAGRININVTISDKYKSKIESMLHDALYRYINV